MTYVPDIPKDLPAGTVIVDQIRTNFSEYANVFDNNHIAMNSANQGSHATVILEEQTINPIVDSNFADLFGKNVTIGGVDSQQLFSMIQKFLPNHNNDPVQLTYNSVNTTPQYHTFLPGGYVVYFDSIPSANVVNTQVTLTPAPSEILCVIPNPTKLGGVGVTPNSPIRISVTVNSASKFTINAVFPTGTGTINWIAIAKQ